MNRLVRGAILLLVCTGPARADGPVPETGTRFIPLQLILGDSWDGAESITYPVGRFTEGVEQGSASVWSGPRDWIHPKTGRTLMVYDRWRGGRNAATQIFAVRDDLAAIGRVADSRFGIAACDQEAKYPLGSWRQGESRSFDYSCWYGDKVRAMVTTLTIHEIDFAYGGREHCLKEEWTLRARDDPRLLDHRIYIFAPGRGMVREWRIP